MAKKKVSDKKKLSEEEKILVTKYLGTNKMLCPLLLDEKLCHNIYLRHKVFVTKNFWEIIVLVTETMTITFF